MKVHVKTTRSEEIATAKRPGGAFVASAFKTVESIRVIKYGGKEKFQVTATSGEVVLFRKTHIMQEAEVTFLGRVHAPQLVGKEIAALYKSLKNSDAKRLRNYKDAMTQLLAIDNEVNRGIRPRSVPTPS